MWQQWIFYIRTAECSQLAGTILVRPNDQEGQGKLYSLLGRWWWWGGGDTQWTHNSLGPPLHVTTNIYAYLVHIETNYRPKSNIYIEQTLSIWCFLQICMSNYHVLYLLTSDFNVHRDRGQPEFWLASFSHVYRISAWNSVHLLTNKHLSILKLLNFGYTSILIKFTFSVSL